MENPKEIKARPNREPKIALTTISVSSSSSSPYITLVVVDELIARVNEVGLLDDGSTLDVTTGISVVEGGSN